CHSNQTGSVAPGEGTPHGTQARDNPGHDYPLSSKLLSASLSHAGKGQGQSLAEAVQGAANLCGDGDSPERSALSQPAHCARVALSLIGVQEQTKPAELEIYSRLAYSTAPLSPLKRSLNSTMAKVPGQSFEKSVEG
ncbi:unnamed protein product, partial [Ixodes pacificus]